MKTTIKTLDIQGKEWFDKVNGNSYWSAQVTINFGMEDEKTVYVPFQYGYGRTFEYEAMRQLQMDGILSNDEAILTPSRFCAENNITLRSSIKTGCKKADVKAWGSN